MLSVVHYHETSEVFELDFVTNVEKKTLVVCPSPSLADDFRLNYSQTSTTQNVDIVTISKFMKDQLSLGFDNIEILRKADFYLSLGAVWKKYFSEYEDEIFFQAFNLFTELRSFTLDLDLILNILQNFDEVVAKAVKIFWLYVNEAELVDEHKSYFLLGEAYRSNEHKVHQFQEQFNIVFWGFGHMSGGQVDLLRALSIRHDIFIPYPREVFFETTASDWIRWFDVEMEEKVNGPEEKERSLNLVTFSKNRLGESINRFVNENENMRNADVFLAQKTPSFNQLNEIPLSGHYFKTNSDLFKQSILEIIDDFKSFIISKNSVEIESCLGFFEELIAEELKLNFKEKQFRKLKALSICHKTVLKMKDLSIENDFISLFDVRIIEQVSLLQIPRTYSIPLINQQSQGQVKGIEGIESYSSHSKTMVCVTSEYRSIKGSENLYDENTIEFLTSVGPVQRKELEYLLIKKRLLEVLNNENTFLFLENGLDEHDLGWNEVLNSFSDINQYQWKTQGKELERHQDVLDDYFTKNEEEREISFSATRLQAFIDCPRSYYFKYLERIEPRPKFEQAIRPDQLGTLEHDIIRKYIENNREWDEDVHRSLVENSLQVFVEAENKLLSSLTLETSRLELLSYTKNGILELLNIIKIDPEAKFTFEYELPRENKVSGSVDCLIESRLGNFILDFKRSGGGIPTIKEVDSFEKVQLWFYLKFLPLKNETYALWGYLNLSSPNESLIFLKNKDLMSELKEVNFAGGKLSFYKNDLLEQIECYSSFNEELIKKIKLERSFKASPRKPDVCTFCTIANICPKEAGGDK